MQRTKIEYAELAWNPIKGLCPVACSYCYARRLYHRFNLVDKDPYLDEKELGAPLKRRKPARIFACTTIEPFELSVINYMKHVFDVMRCCSQHTFLLLTKIPGNFKDFLKETPGNVWLGTTITRQNEVDRAYRLREIPGPAVRWISFEPLLEPVWKIDLKGIDWVVMGRLTGGRGTGPAKPRWFEELIEIADGYGVPVFMKNNLKALPDLRRKMRQTYPTPNFGTLARFVRSRCR